MSDTVNPYKVLGLEETYNASEEDIKKVNKPTKLTIKIHKGLQKASFDKAS